jgi:hypothetical protein
MISLNLMPITRPPAKTRRIMDPVDVKQAHALLQFMAMKLWARIILR